MVYGASSGSQWPALLTTRNVYLFLATNLRRNQAVKELSTLRSTHDRRLHEHCGSSRWSKSSNIRL